MNITFLYFLQKTEMRILLCYKPSDASLCIKWLNLLLSKLQPHTVCDFLLFLYVGFRIKKVKISDFGDFRYTKIFRGVENDSEIQSRILDNSQQFWLPQS